MSTRASAPSHYAFIDSLRALAFLGVLLHHAAHHIPGLGPVAIAISNQGSQGVQLFFEVSALTLFLSLDSRRKTELRPIRNFFIRRLFRIAPLLYAGAVFYYGFDWIMTGARNSGSSSPACILATLVFVNGWSPYWINRLVPGGWSIAVEMNFYLLVPWLFRQLKGLRDAVQLAFVTLIIGATASVTVHASLKRTISDLPASDISKFVYYWLPLQLPIFCLGFALFFILRPILKFKDATITAYQPNPRFLMGLAAYLMAATTFSEPRFYLQHVLYGVAFLLLAWSLALHPTRWLVNPVTRYLGQVSFSAYITHFAVLDLMTWANPGRLPAFAALRPEFQLAVFIVIGAVLTTAVSTLTFRWIEQPGQAVGRKLIQWLEAREAAKTTESLYEPATVP